MAGAQASLGGAPDHGPSVKGHPLAGHTSTPDPALEEIADKLYPDNPLGRSFFIKTIEIVRRHRAHDPFHGGPGPGVKDYELGDVPIAFVVARKGETLNLVLINPRGKAPGTYPDSELSRALRMPVYRLNGIPIDSIRVDKDPTRVPLMGAVFGEIPGNRFGKAMSGEIPAKYLPPNTPLRELVGPGIGLFASPSYSSIVGSYDKDSEVERKTIREMSRKVFERLPYSLVHEGFHVQGANQTFLTDPSADPRAIPRVESAATKLKSSDRLKRLVYGYASLIHDVMSDPSSAKLALLAKLIQAIKKECPAEWQELIRDEYDEGFADYVEDRSAIDQGDMTENAAVEYEWKDPNALFYHTGAMGGLMADRLGGFTWQGDRSDKAVGIWEHILERKGAVPGGNVDAYLNTLPARTVDDDAAKMEEYWSHPDLKEGAKYF